MSRLGALIASLADVRPAERPIVFRAAASCFLLVAAHTVLETARDALLLSKLDPRAIGLTYLLAAAVVLPASFAASRLAGRFGARPTLTTALLLVAAATAALFAAPSTASTILVLYAVSSVVGAVLVPLFWGWLGELLTVSQGRRLLGPIVAAGTLGAVAGSGSAAAVLAMTSVRALLLVSGGVALAAVSILRRSSIGTSHGRTPAHEEVTDDAMPRPRPLSDPFLRHVALLVAASTATIVVLDFTFRWTLTRSLPVESIASFVARFYAVLGVASLLAQLLVSRGVIRHLGVARTMVLTPVAVAIGAVVAFASGGPMIVIVALKALDATLRHSVHRLTMELAYLPLRESVRTSAKPIIDGAIVRTVQGGMGAALLVMGGAGLLSRSALTATLVALAASWLVAAWRIQWPYLALLRRAIDHGFGGGSPARDPLDLESAEALLFHLSSEDPLVVLGSMNAIARRDRVRMIPALILLHEDAAVVTRALSLLASSEREDWMPRARRLLGDGRDKVRMAVVRALAARGQLRARDVADDASARVRGYAAAYLALEGSATADDVEAALSVVVERGDEDERVGVLSAIADVGRNERLDGVLSALARRSPRARTAAADLARAVAAQRAVLLLPVLIARLSAREGREAVRAALLSFGDTALDALREALATTSARALRVHVPSSIARFGTNRAAEVLLDVVEHDTDGLVRYKALRALTRLAVEHHIEMDRSRVERLATKNLLEYARLFALRAALDPSAGHAHTTVADRPPTERLLLGILGDKMRQALERAFRLLELVLSHGDIDRIHAAFRSSNARERANAAELVDALLPRAEHGRLRRLLRWIAEERGVEDVVSELTPPPPASSVEARRRVLADRDAAVAAIAALHFAALDGRASRVVLLSRERPGLELTPEIALATATVDA